MAVWKMLAMQAVIGPLHKMAQSTHGTWYSLTTVLMVQLNCTKTRTVISAYLFDLSDIFRRSGIISKNRGKVRIMTFSGGKIWRCHFWGAYTHITCLIIVRNLSVGLSSPLTFPFRSQKSILLHVSLIYAYIGRKQVRLQCRKIDGNG